MKKIFMGVLLVGLIIVISIALHHTNANAAKKVQESNLTEDSVKTDIVITDSYFIQSTNDVYLNIDNYIGKSIKMEGFIYQYQDYNGNNHYAVVRNSPGCCGNDGLAGLDIEYDDYPEINTWVEVIGTIREEFFDNQRVPVIVVTSMTRKPEGMSFVTN